MKVLNFSPDDGVAPVRRYTGRAAAWEAETVEPLEICCPLNRGSSLKVGARGRGLQTTPEMTAKVTPRYLAMPTMFGKGKWRREDQCSVLHVVACLIRFIPRPRLF